MSGLSDKLCYGGIVCSASALTFLYIYTPGIYEAESMRASLCNIRIPTRCVALVLLLCTVFRIKKYVRNILQYVSVRSYKREFSHIFVNVVVMFIPYLSRKIRPALVST